MAKKRGKKKTADQKSITRNKGTSLIAFGLLNSDLFRDYPSFQSRVFQLNLTLCLGPKMLILCVFQPFSTLYFGDFFSKTITFFDPNLYYSFPGSNHFNLVSRFFQGSLNHLSTIIHAYPHQSATLCKKKHLSQDFFPLHWFPQSRHPVSPRILVS